MAWIELNASDPAPPAGAQNVHFRQAGGHTGTESDPVPTSAFLMNGAVLGWTVLSGVTGTDIGNLLNPLRNAPMSQCVIMVTASDPATDLIFDILQNGASVFAAPVTVAAGTARAARLTFATTSAAMASTDNFSLSITSGTSSWKFSVYVE